MAAAQVHRLLLKVPGCEVPAMKAKAAEMAIHEAGGSAEAAEAAASEAYEAAVTEAEAELRAKAVLQLVRLAGCARDHAREKRSSDPRAADDHRVLFARLQLAAAACVQNDESGKTLVNISELFRSYTGRQALKQAVQIEAKELLAQPVVQTYVEAAWRGNLFNLGWEWFAVMIVLLLQLLILLPLVALVPVLDYRWRNKEWYLLRLPVFKFGLECAADLALALALTLIPAADLATAPFAPLLLVWVGSGLLREACQLMAISTDASSRLARVCNRVVAYWSDHINRVDAMALIFSFAALVAFVSAGDSEDAWATSLRVVAVFLLWLRVIRVLLVSSRFGPFVLMFFRMLFGDVLYFLVLLLFLLIAFAASWTVLLEPESSLIAGCADELGGGKFHTTLLLLLEGALTGSDYFECARNSTNSPVAAWMISFVYVTLTAVLLLNMLIAMMAKTFDNISEASATNYLFLFAQRTLALQNEPPTPPPLNALGLPCQAMFLLWDWLRTESSARLYPKRAAANKYLSFYLSTGASGTEDTAEEKALSAEETEEKALSAEELKSAVARAEELKSAVARATDKARSCAGSWSFANSSWSFYTAPDFAEKIAPLAKKVTEYIIDHQDDAAQEDRWRTTMKRDMGKNFRKAKEEMLSMDEKLDRKLDQLATDLGRLTTV